MVADDRPGLFARIAGTLTANGVDILSVDLFSRRDGVAVDTFRVAEVAGHRPVRADRRERVAAQLRHAVAGTVDVADAVELWKARTPRKTRQPWGRAARPAGVRFDDEASATATVIEVKAADRPGSPSRWQTRWPTWARHQLRQDRHCRRRWRWTSST